MRPMLATRGTYVPAGSEWLHEVKWDGMRVIATVRDGRLTLHSRNENDVTVSFPDLQGLAGRATFGGKDVVLDGEVVAFLDGLPVFGALAERMHVAHARRAEQLAATWDEGEDVYAYTNNDPTGAALRDARLLADALERCGRSTSKVLTAAR